MNPYDDGLVMQTNEKVAALYAEAMRSVDEQYPIWVARTMYDYCGGLPWASSEAKHLAECRAALGLPTPPPPAIDPRIVRANFCNLTDSTGRAIYSACLAGQTSAMQDEWIAQEQIAGGTHYLLCIFSGYHDMYGTPIHFYKDGRMPEWLAALDRILAAGLVPLIMLDPGDAYPGTSYWDGLMAAIPSSYYPKCVWCPGFEPVKGAWSSRNVSDALQKIRGAIGQENLLAVHLSPSRASFSSNPVEPDDPWHGDEIACWYSDGGEQPDLFLYQSPVPPEGVYDRSEHGWCTRAQEVADRFLGKPGSPDWFTRPRAHGRPTLIWMEATAYSFIRGQSTSAWASEVARYAQALGFQGFGNGLP